MILRSVILICNYFGSTFVLFGLWEDLFILFGDDYELTKKNAVNQPGQFASVETVTIKTDKSEFVYKNYNMSFYEEDLSIKLDSENMKCIFLSV